MERELEEAAAAAEEADVAGVFLGVFLERVADIWKRRKGGGGK
jgi:hypothetical protein